MTWLIMAVFGAIAGSFASVAAYRMPRAWYRLDDPPLGLSRPARSFCPRCRSPLAWHDNLPILGWLIRRGHCRACGAAYGAGYLIHELGLAGLFALAGTGWPAQVGWPALLLSAVALTGLWIAAAIDWRWKLLPDGVTLAGIPCGVLAALWVPQFHWWDPAGPAPVAARWLGLASPGHPAATALVSALASALVCALALWLLRRLGSALLRQEALGEGDVLLLAAAGAWLGLEGAAWILCLSVALGTLLGLANVLHWTLRVWAHRRRRGQAPALGRELRLGWLLGREIPFGPALACGAVLVLLFPLQVRRFFLETAPSFLQSFRT